MIKLDIGCGPNKKAGFLGVDAIAFPGVDVVFDVRKGSWPWADDSVEESHCAHFLEHLTNLDDRWERVIFFNELFRITRPGGSCKLIIPHWASARYYGDPTHKEPFSEFGFLYLGRAWREGNAPHTDSRHNPNGYSCNWKCEVGSALAKGLESLREEERQRAARYFKDAVAELIVTMTAEK